MGNGHLKRHNSRCSPNLSSNATIALQLMSRPSQVTVLLIAGLIYAVIIYRALMWAVWGAPTHLVQYVALYSAIGLVLSALLALARPIEARWASIFCTLGVGIYVVPATQSLVPSANRVISPMPYLLTGGYFALLYFCLFHPKRLALSVLIFTLVLLSAAAFGGVTLVQRIGDGEFNRPAISYFQWKPSDAELHVADKNEHVWITEEMLDALSAANIKGSLNWTGSQGRSQGRSKMVVVCRGPIPRDKKLHYPKADYVIYLFDGTSWTMIPRDAPCYPSFATLETDGMIYQTTGGGRQGISAFRW